jgi:GT2 family glycosyltransferase
LASSGIQELTFEAANERPWFFFDPEYYVAQCVLNGTSPPIGTPASYLQHYLNRGAQAGYSPNRFFDEEYYGARYPSIAEAVKAGRWRSGFDHYCKVGAETDYSPAWFFESAFYERSNPDLTDENLKKGGFSDRYSHYLRVGITESRMAHWCLAALKKIAPSFDYPKSRPDLVNFLENGQLLADTFKLVFDYEWMREKYGWNRAVRPEAFVRYYLLNVGRAKLSPSPYFDEGFYLTSYPEIGQAIEAEVFGSGYEHFILHGMAEGRKPSAAFDPQYYFDKNIAPFQNWHGESSPKFSFVHFLRNRATKRLPIARPLAANDIPEAMGKGLYERRCLLNAGRLGSFVFTPNDAPDVSIIIIARDNYEQTANCIVTALCNTKASVEVIVFDNGSKDDTADLPSINPQIKYLSAEKNIGFTIAVNRAAKLATGRMILLLNNDTEVAPQAIDLALARLEADRSIGAVGAKIVRMHGKLQEAGCVLFNDGSCLGYGRDLDPLDGKVNFARDVDFVSGCFLAMLREDWEAMGGFDEQFAPAYYEDTDYCLRVWARGQRVVYDPRILLWHYEYGSSSIQEEALALMRKNQRYFASKHQDFLSACPSPNGAFVERARLRHIKGPRILFVEDRIPEPAKGMGFVRSASVAKSLAAASGLVSVLGLHNHEWPPSSQNVDNEAPIEILTGFNINNVGSLLRSRMGMYDLIWLSRTHNLPKLKEWRRAVPEFFAKARVVLDTEALAAVRRFTYAKQVGQSLNLPALILEELENLEGVDQICVVSEFDRQLLLNALKQINLSIPISILGHSIPVQPVLPRYEETNEIVLLGAYSQPDSPNVDAVIWFDQAVRPLLQDLPEMRFVIAGSEAEAFVKSVGLKHDYRVVNNPPRLRDVYKTARVMVAPTRFAGGIPMKVHEAASYGVPVVMTELLADQLGWRQYGAGIATSAPEMMAEAIRKLVLDREAWQHCQALQTKLVAKECAPGGFDTVIRRIVAGLIAEPEMSLGE